MKNDKKMRSQIVPFIMLVPNCPFYNIGAKLSDAKFSGYQIVQAPDDVDDDHTVWSILRRNYDGYSCEDGRQVWLER